jgi:hypothetical protein
VVWYPSLAELAPEGQGAKCWAPSSIFRTAFFRLSTSRFSAHVGWRGGTSPPRSRQTDREPLDSIGFLPRLARIRLLSVARLAKRSSTKVRAFAPGSLQPLHRYYTLIRPSAPHPVLSPSASASAYSRSPTLGDNGTTGSRVPYKSPHYAHAPYTPDTTWPGTRQPAKLIPGESCAPGSDVVFERFDASSVGSLSLIFVVHT